MAHVQSTSATWRSVLGLVLVSAGVDHAQATRRRHARSVAVGVAAQKRNCKSSFESQIERNFLYTNIMPHQQRPVLYRDLAISYYNSFFETPIRLNWDNAEWDSFDPPESRAHTSPVTCQDACAAHQGCFQWTHYLGRCHFVRSFRFGRARDPPPLLEEAQQHDKPWSPDDRRFVSGWISSRIQKWMDERPCNQVQWVKPSTTRIF